MIASDQPWTYFNPVRIEFMPGAVSRLGDCVIGERVGIVTTPGFVRRGIVEQARQSLGRRLRAVIDDVKPNPDVLDIDAQSARLRATGLDCLIAIGGGSSIDSAKALARLLPQPDGATLAAHFREGVRFREVPALPVVAVPTTAGTGAEVTPFGTVWDFGRGRKYSVSGDDLYPRAAILDPGLTLGLPRNVTIASGLDALSHALESAWNRHASPITLGLSAKSLQLSLHALRRLADDLADVEARGRMMQASLLAGMAISQTRTALAHSISYPLTARLGLPHGVACSFTLPALLEFNAGADDGRLAELARATGCRDGNALMEGLRALFARLGVAELFRSHVPDPGEVLGLVDEMFTPGRVDNNLRHAGHADVQAIVRTAIDQVRDGYSGGGAVACRMDE